MFRVEVLMSTYNGEKYLEEQIDSILTQNGVEVYLLIRDDGSTDRTLSIIEKYLKKDKDKVRLIKGNNKGVKRSFMELVNCSDSNMDYYAFADQDDIWLEGKLKRAINLIGECDKQMPVVYGSNVNVNNAEVLFNGNENLREYTFGNLLIKNYFPGCTMVFNNALRNIVKRNEKGEIKEIPLHDHWLCLLCAGCGGKVIKDNRAYIYYRQHETNVVGNNRGLLTKIRENGLFTSENRRYKIACDVKNLYQHELSEASKAQIVKISNYNENFVNRLNLALDRNIKPVSCIERIILVMTVLIGRF